MRSVSKSERYGFCVPWANERVSEWTRTSVPPSRTGNASRHCRSASPSADAGRRDRVERLAWHVRTDPRDADDDRVERLVEARPAKLDRPNECLRVRDRRSAGEDGGRCEDATLVAQDAAPHGPGEQGVETPERRARDVLESRLLVGVAAEPSRESRVVEHERDGEEADPRGDRRLDRQCQLPDRLAGRLHERARHGGASDRRRIARREERARATVNDGLG